MTIFIVYVSRKASSLTTLSQTVSNSNNPNYSTIVFFYSFININPQNTSERGNITQHDIACDNVLMSKSIITFFYDICCFLRVMPPLTNRSFVH